MSSDDKLANEWARCGGKNASYITIDNIIYVSLNACKGESDNLVVVVVLFQSPCISWPCQNNGTCAALYGKNSYMCVCAKGYTGKYCETGMERVHHVIENNK